MTDTMMEYNRQTRISKMESHSTLFVILLVPTPVTVDILLFSVMAGLRDTPPHGII